MHLTKESTLLGVVRSLIVVYDANAKKANNEAPCSIGQDRDVSIRHKGGS